MLSMEALSINIFIPEILLFVLIFFSFLVILFHFKSIQTPIDISDHSKISALSMLSLNIYYDGLNIVFAMFGSSFVRIKYYTSNT